MAAIRFTADGQRPRIDAGPELRLLFAEVRFDRNGMSPERVKAAPASA